MVEGSDVTGGYVRHAPQQQLISAAKKTREMQAFISQQCKWKYAFPNGVFISAQGKWKHVSFS